LLAAQSLNRSRAAAAVLADLDRVRAGQDPEALTFAFHASADEAPTRRTQPAVVDLEATRRTDRSLGRPSSPPTAAPSAPVQTTTLKTPSPPPVAVRVKRK